MHVLQLTHSLAVAYGGPAFNSHGLNRGLNAQPGFSASIISMRGTTDGVDTAFVAPQEADATHRVPMDARVRGRRALLAELRRADVVVMHGWFAEWLLPAAVLCVLLRVPYVVTPHGALGVHRRRVSRRRKWVYDLLAGRHVRARARCFVVGSETERAELRQVHPALPVVVGGAGTDVWSGPQPRAAHDPLRLLSLSRLAPKKRVDVSIGAVRVLRDLGVDAVLDVAGDGPEALRTALLCAAEAHGVADRVRFLGGVYGTAKEDLLRGADVFVLPSEDENFGIAFVEALAHSLPCVVTRAVAAADGLDPRAVAVIDAPGAESLAHAVVRLAHDGTYAGSRARAHREATGRFTWRAVASHWGELLLAVVEGRSTATTATTPTTPVPVRVPAPRRPEVPTPDGVAR